MHRVNAVWAWLPAFRVVAETEHLPTAAHELGLVPSSLSRAIRLLEDELGVSLFDRANKGLALNDAGRILLSAVRGAMRMLDEALASTSTSELVGKVTAVSSADLARAIVGPACVALARDHPDLVVSSVIADDDSVAGMLLAGNADVAIVAQPTADPDVCTVELGTWTRSAFAGLTHDEHSPEIPRCIGVGSRTSPSDDGWPIGVERRVVLCAPDQHLALELAAGTGLTTVAYDMIANGVAYASRLHRLPAPIIESRALYLSHRRPMGRHPRTELLIATIRASACAATPR